VDELAELRGARLLHPGTTRCSIHSVRAIEMTLKNCECDK
jgi:hypothetical protein